MWAAKSPKPVTKFIAVVQIAQRFLDAGHEPAALEAAMIRVPTISTGWLESDLNRQAAPGVTPDPPAVRPSELRRCFECGHFPFDCTCGG